MKGLFCGMESSQPHEYIRAGTAKLLTLFHPASSQVRVQGVTRSDNAVLYPWLKRELTALLDGLPPPAPSMDTPSAAGPSE